MKISLIGFMGSGKTSVGTALAEKLHFEFIEMDKVVLERTNFKDMKHLFLEKGEHFLREWEIRLAREWQDKEHVVISTGGGVVMNKIVTDYLKKNGGQVIFLHTPFQELEERVIKDKTPRPLFEDSKAARKLYRFRLPLYKAYRDLIIRTKGKTAEGISHEIILKLYKTNQATTADLSPLKKAVDQIMEMRKI